MKCFNILLVLFAIFSATYGQDVEGNPKGLHKFMLFGEKFDTGTALSSVEMTQKYNMLKPADTLAVEFTAKVKAVCQRKGCWMKLALEDGKEAMVRFKDYGFFVPKDMAGKQVFVNGRAFIEETSIADQRHYAKDAGASEKVLGQIKEPKKSFGFLANGVIVRQ